MIGEGGQLGYERQFRFQGATMRTTNRGETYVGLSYPCIKKYDHGVFYSDITCIHLGEKHGHVVISCEDGTGIVPAPITSKSFLGTVLAKLVAQGQITKADMLKVIEHEAKNLPEALTEFEEELLGDKTRLEKYFQYAYCSV